MFFRRAALREARNTCKALANAKAAALLIGDHKRAMYFEHRLDIAKTRRDALALAAKEPRIQRHHVWRAVLIVTAVLWAGVFFFFLPH